MTVRLVVVALTSYALLACSAGQTAGDSDSDAPDASAAGPQADARPPGAPLDCMPPNLLIVLDRTMSMHRRPDGAPAEDTPAGHETSKWWIAIAAVETLVSELDGTIRFGLELFPRDPGGEACVTLSQRIQGQTATNADCEAGEVVVEPADFTAGAIVGAIDPETTRLCTSTPIGAGLGTALASVSGFDDEDRDDYVLLITDGRDTCDEALSLHNAQLIAGTGALLFVVGFDGTEDGIDRAHLNDLACAGRTAVDFDVNCVDSGGGNYVAVNADGPPLFLLVEDQAALAEALAEIAGEICCGCIG